MKRALLLGTLLMTWGATQAQTFTNGDFETWQGPSGNPALENPVSWSGSDKVLSDNSFFLMLVGVTPEQQLFKSTDAHSGTYAAELKTAFLGDTVGNVAGMLINAQVTLDILELFDNPDPANVLNAVTYTSGTPVLGNKVDSVHAWVKLTNQNQDNGSVSVTALKKATTTGGADTMIAIGAGAYVIEAGVSNDYRSISVPVIYPDPNNTATDTLIVVFASSEMGTTEPIPATDGNTLLVDDVTMTTSNGTVSIQQPVMAEDIALVYPNPAEDMIYFNLNTFARADEYELLVTDVTGKVIMKERLQQQVNARDVSGWAKGNYFYLLSNVKNGKSLKGKFTVR